LGALLSQKLTPEEKINIIEKEYDIPVKGQFREDVDVMCNLGQGVEDRAIERANVGMIMSMYDNDIPVEKIAIIAKKTIEEVQEIIEENQAALV
jgi:hypothetical protein